MEAILKLPELLDDKDRKKAMKTASGIYGVDCVSVNMKEGVLTTTGDFDPIQLLNELKKNFSVKIELINSQVKDQKGGGRGGGTAGDTITMVKLDLHDEKDKQKAMKIVSCIPGVYLIWVTMKDSKLTAKGDFDPIPVVLKLMKLFPVKLESVVTVKDEKKGNNNGGNKKGDEQNPKGVRQDQKSRGGGTARDNVVPLHYYPTTHYPPYMHRNNLPMYYYQGAGHEHMYA